MKRLIRGFTLIDLMITVTIVGILAAIAFPSYTDSVRKSRRAEAVVALNSLQLAQEKWRANNLSYAGLNELGISASTESGYYTLAITNPTATAYTATATATSKGSQNADTGCTPLTVNQNGPVYGTSPNQRGCWGRH